MKTRIVLGEIPWKMGSTVVPRHIKASETCFLDLFGAYNPQLSADITGAYGYPAYEFLAPADDPQVKKLLERYDSALRTARRPGAAFFIEIPTADEMNRARFLEPYYFSDFVTEGPKGELNAGLLLCDECEYPNLSLRPEPLLVNKSVLKQYDVFHTGKSFLVVRKWVLALLQEVASDQFEFGEVAIAKEKKKLTGDARLFWLRPKAMIGAQVVTTDGVRTCEACNRQAPKWVRMTEYQIKALGPGLLDDRCRVEDFGAPGLDIAMIDRFSKTGSWPEIVMSGALLAFLKARGAKGVVALTKQLWPQCVFSRRGEPTLETQVRELGGGRAVAKAKGDTVRLAARKRTALLKDLPWDCTADGYVYFHLSTGRFVALDPMTAEEGDGPYEVANFKGPGVYRFPVSAIKRASEDGIAVDSATLLFVDGAFLSDLLDEYEWERATTKGGELNWTYHQTIAEKVGTRFGVCSVPPKKFKSAFKGDGLYRIDARQVRLVEG